MLYRNNLKNRVFDKKAPRNSCLERETIVREQGSSEDKNCEVKPTSSETDSSGCFCIPAALIISAFILSSFYSPPLAGRTVTHPQEESSFQGTHCMKLENCLAKVYQL